MSAVHYRGNSSAHNRENARTGLGCSGFPCPFPRQNPSWVSLALGCVGTADCGEGLDQTDLEMATVMVKAGKMRDLDAKALPFCTTETQQDSLHFPACVTVTLQSSKPGETSSP